MSPQRRTTPERQHGRTGRRYLQD